MVAVTSLVSYPHNNKNVCIFHSILSVSLLHSACMWQFVWGRREKLISEFVWLNPLHFKVVCYRSSERLCARLCGGPRLRYLHEYKKRSKLVFVQRKTWGCEQMRALVESNRDIFYATHERIHCLYLL